MSSVWEVMKAVRGSNLPAPGRHLVLTLCTLADEETGIVPEEDSPSMSDLAEMTGLGRSTVARMLNLVEECKWVEREAPSVADAWARKVSNRYAVTIGTSPTAGLVDVGHDTEATSVTAGLVPERDQSETDNVGLEAVSTSPAAGHASIRTEDSLAKPSLPKSDPPSREDVEAVCRHLVDRIVENGSKRPEITKTWRDEARLMIDKDRRTVESVHKAIDWAHDSGFWRKNIKSMPKLREQFDTLRLAAIEQRDRERAAAERQAARGPATPSAPPKVPPEAQCPKHRGRSKANCGLCRAAGLGATKPPDDQTRETR